jgi:hypothetical protein
MECGICFTESWKWDEMCVEHHRVCVKCSLCMRLAQRQVVNNELVVSCPFCRRAPKSGLRRHAHSLFAESIILRDIPEMTLLKSLFLMAKIMRTALVLYIAVAYTVYIYAALFA